MERWAAPRGATTTSEPTPHRGIPSRWAGQLDPNGLTTWTLESISTGSGGISSVLAGTIIDATFSKDGKVTGSAGCNRYFADYTLDGSSLRIGPVGATKKLCNDPTGIMQQEQYYLARLGSVESYRIEGNRLQLRDGLGSTVLSYRGS